MTPRRLLTSLAAAVVLSTPPALAQTTPQPAARDAVTQPAPSRRLVEELIERLGGNAPPTAQPASAPPQGAASPPQSTAAPGAPVPVPAPPADPTTATPTLSPGASPDPMPSVRSLVNPPPALPTGPAAPPVAQPERAPEPTVAAPQPATPPAPPSSQAATPPVATPRSAGRPQRSAARPQRPFATDADMAKAPEMAEKMNMPRADIEVQFAFDSAVITPAAAEMLDMLGEAMADQRLANRQFVIAGHTDAKGTADYNLALSQRRADAVRQYVIDRHGIDPSNLIARGFGFTRLKNPRQPFAEANRRVQVINWQPEAPPPAR